MRNINGIKGLDKKFLGGSTILVHQIHPKIREGLDPITNFENQIYFKLKLGALQFMPGIKNLNLIFF
jgi:hypothetical protein